MKNQSARSFGVFLLFLLSSRAAAAQDYAWPTNASQWLTSTFGESRPRRFHAGMDVKTWNRIGYEAIAVRDGYVSRMAISPFGYGRALYVKLDTGETAVYAHLLKFSGKLQEIAEAEQERRGRYRIDKQFPAGALPVSKGEVIAYTGQSGIGVPHLHFELRDANGHPANPLRMGFQLEDKTPPAILSLAVKPLGIGSTVNGDFRPQIFQPALRSSWQLDVEEPIAISGKVGLAVSAYDHAAGVDNRYSLYSLKLFVDDELQFQSNYDELDYDNNHYVELDRDFALDHHGFGQFYKLYREPGNPLSFYSSLNAFGGALLCKAENNLRFPNTPAPGIIANPAGEGMNHLNAERGAAAGLSWGMHTFRIEAGDYFGNLSTLEGRLLAGPTFTIEPILLSSDDQALAIKQIISADQPGREIRDVEAYVREGGSGIEDLITTNSRSRLQVVTDGWKKIPVELQAVFQGRNDATMIPLPESTAAQLTINTAGVDLVRLVAVDAAGLRSLPRFIPVSFYRGPVLPLALNIRREFYPDYVRFEIEASQPIAASPLMTITNGIKTGAAKILQPQLIPVEPNLYIAQVPMSGLSGRITVEVSAEDLSGQWAVAFDRFTLTPVPASGSGALISADRQMQVNFWSGSLFGPLYGWVEIDTLAMPDPLRVSEVYRCAPQDLPLANGVNVVISFSDTLAGLHQLGVYTRDENEWEFVDNRLEVEKRQVWARAFALGDFAIFRDNQPPELGRCEPADGATVRSSRPLISVEVRDTMSGFENEEAIVLRLDGRKVIAEYDPERDVVFYTPKQPLSSGRHEYSIRAVDRSGNVAERSASFIVQ